MPSSAISSERQSGFISQSFLMTSVRLIRVTL